MDIITLKNNICNIKNLSAGSETVLEEFQNNKDTELKKLKITDIPADGFLFKTDKIRFDNLFKGTKSDFIKNFNKHSDFVIILNDKIVLVELKSTSFNDEDCKFKFYSDLCVFDYVDSIIKRMCEKNEFFGRLTKHFVVFYLDPIPKTTSTLSPLPTNTDPESFRRIGVQNDSEIPFGMLV